MKAFITDVKANVEMGEFFEYFFANERGLTSFGRPVSISACIGELIVCGNFNEKYNWFVDYLDKIFREPNHCINAYYSEIRQLNKNEMSIENLNPKTNPKTSIIGGLLFTIGLALILMPLFYEAKEKSPEYVNWIFLVSGFGLLLAPDTILDVFTKVVNKKSDKLQYEVVSMF